jgi:glycosyltransferase involved in cell wall biosynthesis
VESVSLSTGCPKHANAKGDEMVPLRLALVTDAWIPQTNGVANTLKRLVPYLESAGHEVLVVAPDPEFHRTFRLPSYPEIRLALDPWKATRRIRAFAPDAVHVATEGPLGFWANFWLRRHGLRFTTSFHTRYPEYLTARIPWIPLEWGYKLVRWFHGEADHTLVSTRSIVRDLHEKRVGRKLVYWPRGVDTALFHPSRRRLECYANLPRPIWAYVGRVAIEKTIEDFLRLPLQGTKVVVGDGPAREELERQFPEAIFRGYRYGEDLATHYASADYFVFPSRTDTFGNVLLEALASGLPVASVPSPGPDDLIDEGVNGTVDDDLLLACQRLRQCDPAHARDVALGYSYRASHELFRSHLVQLRPQLVAEPVREELSEPAAEPEAAFPGA